MATLLKLFPQHGEKRPKRRVKLECLGHLGDFFIAQQSLPCEELCTYVPNVDLASRFMESVQDMGCHQRQPCVFVPQQPQLLHEEDSDTEPSPKPTIRRSWSLQATRARHSSEGQDRSSPAENERRASHLVDQLLLEIYGRVGDGVGRVDSSRTETDCSASSSRSSHPNHRLYPDKLLHKDVEELRSVRDALKRRVSAEGGVLVKHLKRKDALRSKQERLCQLITAHLRAHSHQAGEDTAMRFSPGSPPGGDPSGFQQWRDAMRQVAKLPGGIPADFRRRLWLALADRHLQARSLRWTQHERACFSDVINPDDSELGVQIVKDLHRTGCSLFCGAAGQENQALLKRVLLAYARWNKQVGYCQGFNMLAALILQVMERSETDSLKVMIYLVEGVLPEAYFANNLRGLSVDMAVFRDLLRIRLPHLSRHLELLQNDARDGNSYEPPLTNVFTMQWFLTLFCNCLPQSTVLRVWDLIFLEGNEILLRTAIAIWERLSDRILAVNSADEFYSIMGVLTREMLEFGLVDSNTLIRSIVSIGACTELNDMRDKYMYNITPWTQSVQTAAKKGFRLFYSDDDDLESDTDEKMAVTTAYGINIGRKKDKTSSTSAGANVQIQPYAHGHPDRERLALDISALKKQYAKLRERQRQAHIILTAACARQPINQSTSPSPIAMNHLLLGKNAIVNAHGRRLGPPKGAVPPARTKSKQKEPREPETLHWKDAPKVKVTRRPSLGNGSCKQEEVYADTESSSYSEDDSSSTSTELCDEQDRLEDFEDESSEFCKKLEEISDECQELGKISDVLVDIGVNESKEKETEAININKSVPNTTITETAIIIEENAPDTTQENEFESILDSPEQVQERFKILDDNFQHYVTAVLLSSDSKAGESPTDSLESNKLQIDDEITWKANVDTSPEIDITLSEDLDKLEMTTNGKSIAEEILDLETANNEQTQTPVDASTVEQPKKSELVEDNLTKVDLEEEVLNLDLTLCSSTKLELEKRRLEMEKILYTPVDALDVQQQKEFELVENNPTKVDLEEEVLNPDLSLCSSRKLELEKRRLEMEKILSDNNFLIQSSPKKQAMREKQNLIEFTPDSSPKKDVGKRQLEVEEIISKNKILLTSSPKKQDILTDEDMKHDISAVFDDPSQSLQDRSPNINLDLGDEIEKSEIPVDSPEIASTYEHIYIDESNNSQDFPRSIVNNDMSPISESTSESKNIKELTNTYPKSSEETTITAQIPGALFDSGEVTEKLVELPCKVAFEEQVLSTDLDIGEVRSLPCKIAVDEQVLPTDLDITEATGKLIELPREIAFKEPVFPTDLDIREATNKLIELPCKITFDEEVLPVASTQPKSVDLDIVETTGKIIDSTCKVSEEHVFDSYTASKEISSEPRDTKEENNENRTLKTLQSSAIQLEALSLIIISSENQVSNENANRVNDNEKIDNSRDEGTGRCSDLAKLLYRKESSTEEMTTSNIRSFTDDTFEDVGSFSSNNSCFLSDLRTESATKSDWKGDEFEQFLEERLKIVKKSGSGDTISSQTICSQEESLRAIDVYVEDYSEDISIEGEEPYLHSDFLSAEDKRLELGRRNSERALKIIQENSLILHRILQHQSKSTEIENYGEEISSPIKKNFARSDSLPCDIKERKKFVRSPQKSFDMTLPKCIHEYVVEDFKKDDEADTIKKEEGSISSTYKPVLDNLDDDSKYTNIIAVLPNDSRQASCKFDSFRRSNTDILRNTRTKESLTNRRSLNLEDLRKKYPEQGSIKSKRYASFEEFISRTAVELQEFDNREKKEEKSQSLRDSLDDLKSNEGLKSEVQGTREGKTETIQEFLARTAQEIEEIEKRKVRPWERNTDFDKETTEKSNLENKYNIFERPYDDSSKDEPTKTMEKYVERPTSFEQELEELFKKEIVQPSDLTQPSPKYERSSSHEDVEQLTLEQRNRRLDDILQSPDDYKYFHRRKRTASPSNIDEILKSPPEERLTYAEKEYRKHLEILPSPDLPGKSPEKRSVEEILRSPEESVCSTEDTSVSSKFDDNNYPTSGPKDRSNLTIHLLSHDRTNLKSSTQLSPEVSPQNVSCLQFTTFQKDLPCSSKFAPLCSQTKETSPKGNETKPFGLNLPTLSPPRKSRRSPTSPQKHFSPFPVQPTTRQPKEVGVKLGLYKDLSPIKSPSKW